MCNEWAQLDRVARIQPPGVRMAEHRAINTDRPHCSKSVRAANMAGASLAMPERSTFSVELPDMPLGLRLRWHNGGRGQRADRQAPSVKALRASVTGVAGARYRLEADRARPASSGTNQLSFDENALRRSVSGV
jgi:hypothetical protein